MSGPCCLKSFEWEGKPTGRVDKLANNDAYITGDNAEAAVLLIHDALGWTFPNARLLADHYAREANVTVYLPDFFGGEVLPFEPILKGQFDKVDLAGLVKRSSREVREPEIFACARALRQRYAKVGAVGFCYGGWAVARLAAKEHEPQLVDCIVNGQPTFLTKEDIDGIAQPTQMLAPEIDATYTAELKSYTFDTLMKNGVPFDYQHMPGVEHGCLTRGDDKKAGDREAMVRGKNAAVWWFRKYLH